MINLTTPTSELTTQQIREIVSKTLVWAKRRFGSHPLKPLLPKFSILSKGPKNTIGRYLADKQVIQIFKKETPTVGDLIKTTLHEYTHHTQCMLEYRMMRYKYGYNDSPHEMEARKNEYYYELCWNSL